MDITAFNLTDNFSQVKLSSYVTEIIESLKNMTPCQPAYVGITQLTNVWEEFCVEMQYAALLKDVDYIEILRLACFKVVDAAEPETLALIAFSIWSEYDVSFNDDPDEHSLAVASRLYEDIMDQALSYNNPVIEQYLESKKITTDKISTSKAQFLTNSMTIAKDIIRQIEEGADRFEMPWHKDLPLALNRVTGNFYSGMNQLILWNACRERKYKSNEWATLWQWNRMRGKVKKGEKSTKIMVVLQRKIPHDPNQLSLPNIPSSPFTLQTNVRFFSVFNIAQVSDLHLDQPDLFSTPPMDLNALKAFILATEASIVDGGTRAFYNPVSDFIQMPEQARFKNYNRPSEEAYYSVLLHELIHWTGHKSRCNRQNFNRERIVRYAFEELVAELGAAMLSSYFKQTVFPAPEHAGYINSWLRVLKRDFNYFYQAQNQALIAINWLFVKTKFFGLQLRERPNVAINDDRFDSWNALAERNDPENEDEMFRESLTQSL